MLIHRIPSYFDTPDLTYLELNANMDDTTSTVREATRPLSLVRPDVSGPATNVAVCRGASPCKTCMDLIAMVYDNTLCQREVELIKKRVYSTPSKMMTTSTGRITGAAYVQDYL